jgi:hypothetical protein
MNHVIALFLGIGILLFSSCSVPNVYKADNSVNKNVSLMPFEMVLGREKVKDSAGNEILGNIIYGMGYIDAGTFEIVIPAQYRFVHNFVGDFALVEIFNSSSPSVRGKKCIINKMNKVILDNFDDAILLESEDGKTVFALTGNYSGMEVYMDGEGFTRSPNIRPKKTNYWLYNLTAGKLVINKHTTNYDNFFDNVLKYIKFIDTYLVYDNFVHDPARIYEIKNDGSLERIEMQEDEIVEKITKERNLQFKENEFHYNIERLLDSYFWYSDTLDINVLLQSIPDNMRLLERKRPDWRFDKDEKPIYDIEPFDYNAVYPLKRNILYTVDFVDEKNEKFIGLYNALEKRWAILPVKEYWNYGHFNFSKTGYDNWIVYRQNSYYSAVEHFYNISTGKKYESMYRTETHTHDPYHVMIYAGYLSEEYKEEGKDF